MAKIYQVPSFVRLGNFFTTRLLRAGVKPGNMALLTVRGRKSGLPRQYRYLANATGGAG